MTSDKKGLTNPVISAIYEVENTSQTHQPPDKGSFLYGLLFESVITLSKTMARREQR